MKAELQQRLDFVEALVGEFRRGWHGCHDQKMDDMYGILPYYYGRYPYIIMVYIYINENITLILYILWKDSHQSYQSVLEL